MLTYPSPSPATARTIARDLEKAISSGHPAPGHNLPSERDLARTYHVSRQTVRAAITRLHDDGWVRRDRLGTFVLRREQHTAPPAHEEDFPGNLLRTDVAASSATSGALRLAPLPSETADDLHAPAGVTTLVHDHHVHGPRGEVLQTTRTYLTPGLPELLPQLASLRSAARLLHAQQRPTGLGEPDGLAIHGVLGADLNDLYRWLHSRGHAVRVLDTAVPTPPSPGMLTVRRHVIDHRGHPLAHATITLAAEHADRSRLASQLRPVHGAATTGHDYTLTSKDRAWLEAWTMSRPVDRALALRARIVLVGETQSPEAVAAILKISPRLVRGWQDRFRAGGPPALQAQSRRGRPRAGGGGYGVDGQVGVPDIRVTFAPAGGVRETSPPE